MPVVYTNPTYPWQVSFGGQQAASTQLSYRQMLNEVLAWNPNLDSMLAGRFINNYYRKVIDKRSWYGLKIKGQLTAAAPYNQGTVTVTQGNALVNGVGTNWPVTPQNQPGSIIGLQFRTSFTLGYQTIVNVLSPTQLQLDTPYPSQTLSDTGYQIMEAYCNFGANIKRLLWATNQQQGWPMKVNWPVETLNQWDAWRISIGWSTHFFTRAPAPDGSMLAEVWPTPYALQTFPFEAYMQPPDLVKDSDAMVAWIASDLIVKRAAADAIMHPSNKNRDAFSLQVATQFLGEFKERCEELEQSDNDMDQKDVTWNYGEEGDNNFGPGSTFAQNHDV
jgi:hypothetical protein